MEKWAWEYSGQAESRPRDVAVIEGFLNTVDRHTFGAHAGKSDAERDLLSSPRALSEWLRGHGLLAAGERISRPDLDTARRLRDGLRAWLEARQGLGHDRDALDAAAALLAILPLQVDLGHRSLGLEPHRAGQGCRPLARLLAMLVVVHATGQINRMRICSAPDCRFVFYDRSRSRTSRWCSMSTCGNRFKTRRYRARRSASA